MMQLVCACPQFQMEMPAQLEIHMGVNLSTVVLMRLFNTYVKSSMVSQLVDIVLPVMTAK